MPLTHARCHRLGALVCIALSIIGAPAAAAEPKGKLIEESWDAAYIHSTTQGYVLHGYVCTTIEQFGEGDSRILRGTQKLNLTFRRDGQTAQMRAEQGTDERPDGLVTAISFKATLGPKQELRYTGRLKGKDMVIQADGVNAPERSIPWNPRHVGLVREQDLLRDKKVKPGDSFVYYSYQPSINNVAMVKVAVKGVKETEVPGSFPRKLLKVELRPEKMVDDGKGGEKVRVALPGSDLWVDPVTYKTVKSSAEIPGVATLWLVRTTKEVATAPTGKVVDFISNQSIRLSEPIRDVHNATAVSYRFTLKGADAQVKGIVKEDARQRMRDLGARTFVLDVEAVRGPRTLDSRAKSIEVGDEYRKSNYFITSDDPKVRELARKAAGNETDAWKVAQQIERWVRLNMKPVDYTQALATADEVARTLSGDCTEFAMLAAAMCRAQGIPSRTAIGLVYVDHARHGPILAFHMWTEVFVKGQWLAIDATMGRGSVGPGHIKITDHHWNDVRDFSPLLPVTGFILAKPSVEVISYRRAE